MIPPLLYVALDFYRDPRRFEHLRDPRRPLPEGVTALLGAPAGCLADDQLPETEAATGASGEELRDAVTFFAKQAMLEPAGDYYRLLGVPREAAPALVKQHYYYLMRLFHPDRDVAGEGWDDLYAPRINEAYQVLRHGDKRAAYDATLPEEDGFNPAALAESAVGEPVSAHPTAPAGAGAPPRGPGGGTPSLAVRGGWYTRPWLYAGVVGVVLAVMLALYLSRPTDGLTMVVPGGEALDAAAAAGRGEGAAPTGTAPSSGRTPPSGETAPSVGAAPSPRQGQKAPAGDGAAPTAEARSIWQAEASSDAAIEAMVRDRVAQATIAVLGAPRPEPAPDPAPASGGGAPPPRQAAETVAKADAGQGTPSTPEPPPQQPLSLLQEVAVLAGPRLVVEAFPEAPSPRRDVAEAADAGGDDGVPPTGGAVTDDEVATLLARLVMTYERGDAAAFSALFTADAETTDANGRDAIEALYGDFFATLAGSRFELTRVRWSEPAPERTGSARATILTRSKAGGSTNTVRLAMAFTVRRDGGAVRISRMDYR